MKADTSYHTTAPDPNAPNLSACIIGQDMASRLPPLLDQLAGTATEIVYVDGGSRDDSCELVARYPRARIIEQPFDGNFARQRNVAIEHAHCKWILFVDTDELLGPRLLHLLPRLVRSRATSLLLPRYWLVSDTTFIKAHRMYPDRQLRLFRNRPEIRYDESRPVHEMLPRDAVQPVLRLKSCHILHYCLMWLDREQRERKAAAYGKARPDGPRPNRFYLYEDMPHRVGRCREGWTAGRPYLRPDPRRGLIDRWRLWRGDRIAGG